MLNAQCSTLNCGLDVERRALDVRSQTVSSPENVAAFRRSLVRWYRRYGRDLPWRRTSDPYAVLVSEVMLQQTQVATVIPYYRKWLRQFPNFASLARTSENEVLLAWQGLGYYVRARNLQATAKAVMHEHCGQFPRPVEKMQRLPGIGKYTAHAVASFAFNQSVPIVEANTARVLTRLFNVRHSIDSGAGRRTLWKHAADLLPTSDSRTFNSALLDLGALICVARNPKCGHCPVKSFCCAKNPASLPVKRTKVKTKRIIERHALIVRRGRVLLQRSRHRWRGMWILPPLEVDNSTFQARPVHKHVFPFTHHQITLAVYRQTAPRKLASGQQWIEAIDDVPMPSPHRRAIEELIRTNCFPSAARAAPRHPQKSSEWYERIVIHRVIRALRRDDAGRNHQHRSK
jgi:A/G-specific adenine glycosylase